jgi:hypothetical protein
MCATGIEGVDHGRGCACGGREQMGSLYLPFRFAKTAPKNLSLGLGTLAYVCNPASWEAEVRIAV